MLCIAGAFYHYGWYKEPLKGLVGGIAASLVGILISPVKDYVSRRKTIAHLNRLKEEYREFEDAPPSAVALLDKEFDRLT